MDIRVVSFSVHRSPTIVAQKLWIYTLDIILCGTTMSVREQVGWLG